MDLVGIADMFRDAMFLILTAVCVIILPSLVVGLVVSTFQAATQINEQTLSFLPRLLVTIMMVVVAGPWLVIKIVDYTQGIIINIPYLIG
jgi:flagellar biosynthesis protein FliQ